MRCRPSRGYTHFFYPHPRHAREDAPAEPIMSFHTVSVRLGAADNDALLNGAGRY
jgi:hypothetical protein